MDLSINNTSDSEDESELSEKDLLIKKLYIMFINKYNHLNNDNNKKIIYNLFDIVITNMPENKNNLSFYLNFIESSINSFSSDTFSDLKCC